MFKKLLTLSLIPVVTAISIQANAASYDSVYYLNRYNTVGTSTAILPPHSNHFCFLTRVGVRETDTGSELARCTVRRSGTVWIMEAYLGTSSDADIQCGATCYNNW
jgi:hypothetical protein